MCVSMEIIIDLIPFHRWSEERAEQGMENLVKVY